jgi:hypothetical protein
VIDRVRLLVNRPLSEGERRRLFALAAAAILVAAGALAVTDRSRPRSQHATRSRAATAPAPPAALSPLRATDAVSLQAPSEEGRPGTDLEGTRTDVDAAKRAARRFLTGYLPYSYGRRSARRIPAATTQLRRDLAANPPRVPTRERRRHPRLVLLQSNGVGPVRGDLVALVRDGRLRYTVALELARRRHGWAVTVVGS